MYFILFKTNSKNVLKCLRVDVIFEFLTFFIIFTLFNSSTDTYCGAVLVAKGAVLAAKVGA